MSMLSESEEYKILHLGNINATDIEMKFHKKHGTTMNEIVDEVYDKDSFPKVEEKKKTTLKDIKAIIKPIDADIAKAMFEEKIITTKKKGFEITMEKGTITITKKISYQYGTVEMQVVTDEMGLEDAINQIDGTLQNEAQKMINDYTGVLSAEKGNKTTSKPKSNSYNKPAPAKNNYSKPTNSKYGSQSVNNTYNQGNNNGALEYMNENGREVCTLKNGTKKQHDVLRKDGLTDAQISQMTYAEVNNTIKRIWAK